MTKMIEGITVTEYKRAQSELQAEGGRLSFFIHAAIYVLFNILFIVINLVFAPGFLWFFYPLIGWGIGLTMHYIFGYRLIGKETEKQQAKIEERARKIRVREASVA